MHTKTGLRGGEDAVVKQREEFTVEFTVESLRDALHILAIGAVEVAMASIVYSLGQEPSELPQ